MKLRLRFINFSICLYAHGGWHAGAWSSLGGHPGGSPASQVQGLFLNQDNRPTIYEARSTQIRVYDEPSPTVFVPGILVFRGEGDSTGIIPASIELSRSGGSGLPESLAVVGLCSSVLRCVSVGVPIIPADPTSMLSIWIASCECWLMSTE